ncbi:MAG: HlyC/CorC family transporter [Rhodothermales bacterium]|nr:HlyC/CorC family transporter [Rhodothermales bacterium]
MALLIFYVALALGVSFLCSIMEAVLLTVSPSFVARAEAERGLAGRTLAELKRDVDRPLAAILSLNTIAHTVGAAGAGAQATVVFGNEYIGVASGVLTLLILVVSEIIPKTIGALYWRNLALPITRLLVPTIWLMWPLVKLAQGLTRLIAGKKKMVTIHRDEFAALAKIGVDEGVLEEHESRMLSNLFRLKDLTTKDIMTPRTVIFALEGSRTVGDALEEVSGTGFSRIPLFAGDKDRIQGFVLKSQVLLHAARGETDVLLSKLMQPITAVHESMSVGLLFEKLIADRQHIAVVVGDFGGTSGLVTLEDLVETLIGIEILDEADTIADLQHHARERWRQRAASAGIDLSGSVDL